MQKPKIYHHLNDNPKFIQQDNYKLLGSIDLYYWPSDILNVTNNTVVVWKIKYKK